MTRSQNIIDRSAPDRVQWYVINDGVMGGVSQSTIQTNDDGTAVFTGTLSLENNGGFASVRAAVGIQDLSAYGGLEIRSRGDGRTYQVRLRTNDGFDGIAYRADIETRAGEWMVQYVPFESFVPTYRGRSWPEMPPLDLTRIQQVGFLLADKRPGGFLLEIDHVKATRPRTGTE